MTFSSNVYDFFIKRIYFFPNVCPKNPICYNRVIKKKTAPSKKYRRKKETDRGNLRILPYYTVLISKLQLVKNCANEIVQLKKELRQMQSADPLTKAGLKKRENIPQIKALIFEAEEFYKLNRAEVEDWLNTLKAPAVDPKFKEAIEDYYVKNRTLSSVGNDSMRQNFIRDVRNLCHGIH